jgi:hypothetical protein
MQKQEAVGCHSRIDTFSLPCVSQLNRLHNKHIFNSINKNKTTK